MKVHGLVQCYFPLIAQCYNQELAFTKKACSTFGTHSVSSVDHMTEVVSEDLQNSPQCKKDLVLREKQSTGIYKSSIPKE